MSLKYKQKVETVEVDRFFPQLKPWPEGIEQFTKEKTESFAGETNEWFGWIIMTPDGWEEVKPLDYILTKKNGEQWVYDQKELFEAYDLQ